MDYQYNYTKVQRLDDHDCTSSVLITDEELDRHLEEMDEAYRVFEENENENNILRNRHKNLNNVINDSNIINDSNVIKIHKNTKTIYLTRFAFLSLLLAVNYFAYYFTLNQHKFIKLIKN